jgi:hypothetical protein
MRSLYLRMVRALRRFFRAAGIPVPGAARRLNARLKGSMGAPTVPKGRDFAAELEALNRRVERLETQTYLESIGRRDE